tara:strand:+ start:350 stop:502 length:153 start_codon:yes stop_codon:yes gene_type:complete
MTNKETVIEKLTNKEIIENLNFIIEEVPDEDMRAYLEHLLQLIEYGKEGK